MQENIAQNYFSIKLHSTNYNISLNFNELQNNFQVQLINMSGKVVLKQKYAEAQSVNLLSINLSNGLYYICVIAKEFTTGQFVVVNHTSDQ